MIRNVSIQRQFAMSSQLDGYSSTSSSNNKRLRCQDMEEFQRHKKVVEDEGMKNLKISFDDSNDEPVNTIIPNSNITKDNNLDSINDNIMIDDRDEVITCDDSSSSASLSLPSTSFLNIHPIKGKKYTRKVDYLIDDIIRKSRKLRQLPISDFDSKIPNTIGPQPTTDHALSVFVDSNQFLTIDSKNNANSLIVTKNNSNDDNLENDDQVNTTSNSSFNSLFNQNSFNTVNKMSSALSSDCHHANSLSHSDWDMVYIYDASNDIKASTDNIDINKNNNNNFSSINNDSWEKKTGRVDYQSFGDLSKMPNPTILTTDSFRNYHEIPSTLSMDSASDDYAYKNSTSMSCDSIDQLVPGIDRNGADNKCDSDNNDNLITYDTNTDEDMASIRSNAMSSDSTAISVPVIHKNTNDGNNCVNDDDQGIIISLFLESE